MVTYLKTPWIPWEGTKAGTGGTRDQGTSTVFPFTEIAGAEGGSEHFYGGSGIPGFGDATTSG